MQREGPREAVRGRGPRVGEQRLDGAGGAVVAGQLLVDVVHGDDLVGVVGRRVPVRHHLQVVGVGEGGSAPGCRLGGGAGAGGQEQGEPRGGDGDGGAHGGGS